MSALDGLGGGDTAAMAVSMSPAWPVSSSLVAAMDMTTQSNSTANAAASDHRKQHP
jgi:hypothetical protein